MFQLTGKTAVVTGGGSGIGRGIALLFGKQGAEVHIIDRNEEAGNEVSHVIINQGGKAVAHNCDVTEQGAVMQLFQTFNRVDILVNSAGLSHVGTVESTTEEDFDLLYKVNVKGVYNCLKAAISLMKEQKNGVILNLASIANHVGLTDRFAYSMSKGAVYSMTLSVARDYISYGIRCNSISPARVHTPFVDAFLKKNYPGKEQELFEKLAKAQPVGRMATPEEVAHLVLYLCSDEAAFITGCDYPFDGGFLNLNT